MRLFLLAVVGFFLLSSGVGSGRSSFGPLIFDPAWSPNGKWIAFSGGPFGEPGGIFLVRPDGRGFHRLTPKSLDAAGPVWAPDGRDILFVTVGSGLGRLRDRELYVMKADGSMLRRLTRNAADDTMPIWSPNGKHIAFTSERAGNFDIYTMDANGRGLRRWTSQAADERAPAWSPDGRRLAFIRGSDFAADVFVTKTGKTAKALTRDHGGKRYLAWSTSGPTLASGGKGLWLISAGGGRIRPVSFAGEVFSDLYWSPDGKHLLFQAGLDVYKAKTIWLANARTGALKSLGYGWGGMSWAPGGRRFAFASFGSAKLYAVDAKTGRRTLVPISF